MKLKTIFAYLCIPVTFSAAIFIYAAISRESFGLERMGWLLGAGFLFYAAPYFLWSAMVVIVKASNMVAHVGFLSVTIALFLIACFWLLPGDPSGYLCSGCFIGLLQCYCLFWGLEAQRYTGVIKWTELGLE